MINLRFYSFLTGLHLAILQFSYLIVLQINLSSTYVTYMIIVLSWMVGSIAGLWIKSFPPVGALILGSLSYYGIYFWLIHDPFSNLTLPLAACCVMVSGFWAGRFFMEFLPRLKKSDRLFFNENNGFLTGIILFFLGFTLGGRSFILWTPASLTLVLVFYHWWIAKFTYPRFSVQI